MPDVATRADALDSLVLKRDNVEGASLFSILPRRRNKQLVKLLVSYQVMWDFLDSVSERGASTGHANGRQLHRALVEALDPEAPISDYYRYHPWKDDGGYLLALVEACRRMCVELPSYRQVRKSMLHGVERCAIQHLNHEPEPRRRDAALRDWAEREHGDGRELHWFESTAAAGAFMPHVLFALAAEPVCEWRDLMAVQSAYFPWVALAITMLDSYVDRTHDVVNDSHSYISHYPSEIVALERLVAIIRQMVSQARGLPNGRRHVVLTEGIVAMYLSTPGMGSPKTRETTRTLVDASGPLTRLLLVVARVWRATRSRDVHSVDFCHGLPPGMPLPTPVLTYAYWRSPFSYMERCKDRYGKRFTHRMTSFPRLVFLSDPAEVKAMLAAPADMLHPGKGGAKIAPIVGRCSFMLLDGSEHLNGRRAVLPALRKRMVETESLWGIDTMRRTIALWPQDASLPLHPRLRALTLKVILQRVFAGGERQYEDRLSVLLDKVLAMLAVTGSVVFPVPNLRHGPGRTIWRRFQEHRSEVDTLIHALIDERRHSVDGASPDALAALLAARSTDGTPMTRAQLRDNVMSLILAGHETTASQLAWAFQLLAHNPRVQRRLIEEIDEGAGDAYMTATIQEVLRHRPVFLFTIPRAVVQPIEIGGWTYEPPAHLLGCIYLLHHDPDVYPEPDEFRPERFLEGQPSPHAYLPWGGGRRRCPGSHLALLEMQTVLRTVLETMTVSPASRRMERPRWRSVIVTPHAGSRVVLRSRECRPAPGRRARRAAIGACPAPIHTADLAEHGP